MNKCLRCKRELPENPKYFIGYDPCSNREDSSNIDDIELIGELCDECGEFCKERVDQFDQEIDDIELIGELCDQEDKDIKGKSSEGKK